MDDGSMLLFHEFYFCGLHCSVLASSLCSERCLRPRMQESARSDVRGVAGVLLWLLADLNPQKIDLTGSIVEVESALETALASSPWALARESVDGEAAGKKAAATLAKVLAGAMSQRHVQPRPSTTTNNNNHTINNALASSAAVSAAELIGQMRAWYW